ncbi:MAG: gliding motility lipoprotein GldH [Thermaurantimonas sp.]
MNLLSRVPTSDSGFIFSIYKSLKTFKIKDIITGRLILILVFIIAILLLAQCSERNVYHMDLVTIDQPMHKDSIVCFTFFVEDTSKVFTIKTILYYTDQYPFSNLYLERQILYDSKKEYGDTANYILFDHLGKMTGKGFSNQKKLENLVGRGPLKFKNPGYYSLCLQHLMRIDSLPGISRVGILITEIKQ